MVEFIAHRINKLSELKGLNREVGVELDLRDSHDRLHIAHDPFVVGEPFEEYVAAYKHGTMILNIKSERIEHRVLDIVKRSHINNYFFLDSSFPMLKHLSDIGEHNLAIRFSEFEGMEVVRTMSGRALWVWVDCFSMLPLTAEVYREIKELGYSICIVSPELQNQDDKIEVYGEYLKREQIVPDAICSKMYNFGRWNKFFDLKFDKGDT